MLQAVSDSYDAMVDLYVAVNRDALDHDEYTREWMAEFAEAAAGGTGPVADLGCGPGFATNYLAELGVTVRGYDISPAMITKAQEAFPQITFEQADFRAIDLPDASLAGIMSRYSLIHSPPEDHPAAFAEFARLLAPGAPALISFFAAGSADRHGTPFDHKVVTAYELCPDAIISGLRDAGFIDFKVDVRPPHPDHRQIDHGIILARR